MRRFNYDFGLTIAAVILMFSLSLLCIGSMFYFKWADLAHVSPMVKVAYQERMNQLAAPLVGGLLLVLALCIPNRLLSSRWLNLLAGLMGALLAGIWIFRGWRLALLSLLLVSSVFQMVVLLLVLSGRKLNFRCEGYRAKLGSSLLHLGLVLFCLTVVLLGYTGFLPWLFWLATSLVFLGLVLV